MTCNCSIHSAFRWKDHSRPSIFVRDGQFTPYGTTGKTKSATASEAVDRVTERTGRNPGSIRAISSHGDYLIEEAEHRRRSST